MEEKGEIVQICRNGKPIAELKPIVRVKDPLKMHPKLKKVTFKQNMISPLSEDEWPEEYRLLPLKPEKWIPDILEYHGVREIPVDSAIAILSSRLQPLHNDTADRIIIATSIIYNMTILTPDPLIKKYTDIKVKW